MTDHRTLKKLVRERMAQTGERYTTAHRHVVGQAARTARSATPAAPPVPPAGLVPGYPVDAAGAEHHASALVRSLLAHGGIEMSEAMVCGLGGGIGFLYAVFEYRGLPAPLLTVVAQHHPQPWLDAVAGHLGLTLATVTSSRPGPALAKLDGALDAGRPARVLVAAGHLPWRDAEGAEAAAEPTAVVVAGRDGTAYLVDDGDGELRRVDAEALGVAWAAHRAGRFALTTLDRPEHRPDLDAGVRAALATTHAHLTGPVLGLAFDVNFGLSGMRRLAADLADTRTARGWARRFAGETALRTGTGRLAECLTSAYTAPGGTRPLYSRFLAEASGRGGLDLVPASRTAAEAGRVWTEVADVAGGVTADDGPTTVLARLAELVTEAVRVEERLADEIGAALRDA